MSWRDRVLKPSFRGVPFDIESSSLSGGRYSVKHNFIGKNEAHGEDLGGKDLEFSLEAFVFGEDYDLDRKRLIDALNKGGSGELIHPFYGQQNVFITTFTVAEQRSPARKAKFSISFFRATEAIFPKGRQDFISKIDEINTSIGSAAQEMAEKSLRLDQVPGFVLDSANDLVKKAIKVFDDISANTVDPIEDYKKDLIRKVKDLERNINTLLKAPGKLMNSFSDVFTLSFQSSFSPGENSNNYRRLRHFGLGIDTEFDSQPTVVDKIEKRNSKVIIQAVRSLNLAMYVKATFYSSFTSTADAESARDDIVDLIDRELDFTLDDNMFSSLQQLKAETLRSIPPDDTIIQKTSNISMLLEKPSLLVVHEIYGSIDLYHEDFLKRNRTSIFNPAFVPSNKDLEIIEVSREDASGKITG